jgi:serine/threonine protein kinase
MVTMGTGDVVDVLSFAQAQVSLFEGLVIMASKNSVHHDIKPDNVMYVRGFTRNDSKFVFIDFGIAGPEHYEDMRPEPYRYFAPEYNAYVRDTLTTYLENLMGTKASIGVEILQDDGTMTPSMTAETFFALVQRTCVDLKLQPPVHSLPSFDAQGSLLTDCLLQSGSTLVTFQEYVDGCWEAHAKRNGFDPKGDHPASVMAQSDMFALGLTLMEVLITAKHLGFIDSRSQGYVRTVWDGLFALYLKMMDFDIAKRPTAEAALHKLNEIIAAGNADVARMKGRRKPTLS